MNPYDEQVAAIDRIQEMRLAKEAEIVAAMADFELKKPSIEILSESCESCGA